MLTPWMSSMVISETVEVAGAVSALLGFSKSHAVSLDRWSNFRIMSLPSHTLLPAIEESSFLAFALISRRCILQTLV